MSLTPISNSNFKNIIILFSYHIVLYLRSYYAARNLNV